MFLIDFLKQSVQKKEAANIVISAETISYDTGLNAIDIINQYEKQNPYITEIKKMYAQNKPKHVAYSKIFDKQFLFILKACEEKGLLIGEIFKDYMNVKEKIQTAKNKITSAITYPFLSYFLSSFIVFVVLTQMNKQLKNIQFIKTQFIDTVLTIYWPCIIGIAFMLLFPLLKLPRYIPILKTAYKELDAFQYVSGIYFILKSGLSMIDVYDVFKEKIPSRRKNVEGVIDFLKKYLTSTEIYAVKIAVQTFKFEEIFKSILTRRQEEFESKISKSTSAISSMLLFIVVIPAVFMLFVMFRLYTVVSTASRAGGM